MFCINLWSSCISSLYVTEIIIVLWNSFKHALNLVHVMVFRALIVLLFAARAAGCPFYACIGILQLFQALSMMAWFVLFMVINTLSWAIALLSSKIIKRLLLQNANVIVELKFSFQVAALETDNFIKLAVEIVAGKMMALVH